MKRILIVKTSSLGDVIHNLPVVNDILNHHPDAVIDWVVEEGFADMKIYPWPLWFNTRIRSFRHLTRYSKLNKQFGDKRWVNVINSYLEDVEFDKKQEETFKKKIILFLKTPYH